MSDYISRAEIQDYIAKYLSQYLYDDVRSAVEVIDEYIGELPSADVRENVHGEWIDKGSLSCRCSECGCKSTAETNFCAVCGADMRKGET